MAHGYRSENQRVGYRTVSTGLNHTECIEESKNRFLHEQPGRV